MQQNTKDDHYIDGGNNFSKYTHFWYSDTFFCEKTCLKIHSFLNKLLGKLPLRNSQDVLWIFEVMAD